MTRKHYEALAAGLKACRPAEKAVYLAKQTWQECVAAVSIVLSNDNPRFNRDLFYKACGMPNE